MRASLTIVALLICNLGFSQKGTVILVDSAALSAVMVTYQLLNISASDLSNSELGELKKQIKKFIKQHNVQLSEKNSQYGGKANTRRYGIKKLKNYKIQVVPFLNEHGEKEVWINGFCDDSGDDWREDVIWVLDGGNCFFTMRINLTNESLISAGINGYS